MKNNGLKNEKAITLIALVVTIIVLIILAGVSISTLKKKNGIAKNANYAGVTNAYYSANQQAELAHSAVLTEIMNQTASNYNYNPTTSEETTRLADIVKKDLGITSGNTNGTWAVDSSEAGKIKITYTDDKIVKNSIDSETPRNDGIVNYKIKLKRDQDAELYVDVAQQLQRFITYGPYENTAGYGSIGTRVFLVSGSTEQNPQTISVGDGTIQDNWKVFYEDEDFVYLIYGDYYPVNVQTNDDINTIRFGRWKTFAVSDSQNRDNLLKYLRNNSAYEWNSGTMTENHGTGGSTYASWDRLRTAIATAIGKNESQIAVQGSPDIDLWNRSWMASGNTAVLNRTSDSTLKNENGYLMRGSTIAANVSGETGYSNKLYFPYTGNTSSDGLHAADANGYELASPGSDGVGGMCYVAYNGRVYCVANYDADAHCARPVVSIAK